MRLSYNEPDHSPGKTSRNTDEVEVRFLELIADKRIEQVVTFESQDPAYAGRDENDVGLCSSESVNRGDRTLRECARGNSTGRSPGRFDFYA